MTLSRLAPVGAVLLLGLAGCAAPRDLAWPERRPLGADYPAYVPPASPEAVALPIALEPTAELTLRAALGRALLHNPGLHAFGWEVRAREARALQARLWPNPEISVEAEEFGGSSDLAGMGAAEIGVALSQVVPLGGDIGARRRVAAHQRDLAGWEYEAARLDVLTATTQAFAEVLAAQERLRLADDLLALAERFTQTVTDRAEAGKVSPIEATRADIVHANAEIARRGAARDLTAARKRLSSLWNAPEPDFERVVGDFGSVLPVPPFDALADLLASNPDVARWGAEVAHRRASLRLARAERIPDPVVSGGARRVDGRGETTFSAGVAIPLPVFDRDQGVIQEARYRIRQAESGAEQARADVRRRLVTAYERLAGAHDAATTLEAEVLPAATEMFEAAQEGYREGKFDLLSVLDAQRTLVEATTRYLDAAETYHRARAEVERLVATPLSTMLSGAAPDTH